MSVMFREEFYVTVICDDYCSDDDTIVRVALFLRARALLQGTDKNGTVFYRALQYGGLMTPVYIIRASFRPYVFRGRVVQDAADSYFSHVYI